MERYSYKKFFQKIYDDLGQRFAFQAETQEEAQKWQKEFRSELKKILGLELLEQIAEHAAEQDTRGNGAAERKLSVTQKESVRMEGYTRHKLVLETLPEVFMPVYLLVPDGITVQYPGKTMIAIPAHGANKETVAGTGINEAVREKMRRNPKESYGLEFVRRGYVVFCPDPPGYGERLEPIPYEDRTFRPDLQENPLGGSCKDLAQTAEALGFSLTALEIWDLMRLVDYACTCPEVDSAKIGCAGFSGGGQYAMWLAAMDDRIKVAVVSGYVHGYYDSILDVHLCPCNYAPNIWRLGDISDICSLIAPRALFVENGIQDHENGRCGIDGPKEQVRKIRRTYRAYGKEENLCHVTPEGPHMWYGECYDFVELHLDNSSQTPVVTLWENGVLREMTK